MTQQTPLFACHIEHQAKMVPFGGWEMPLHYGSQLLEHHAVRQQAGMFDVSHMTIVDVQGQDAKAFLRYVIANDIERLHQVGKALYGALLNTQGGVIDDLIVYYRGTEQGHPHYRVILNAATRDKDWAWLQQHATPFAVQLKERTDLAMIAVQGPQARELAVSVMTSKQREHALALGAFFAADVDGWFIGRTGYTGEDGFEMIIPAHEIAEVWRKLYKAGVTPCGLGARDTLRLEAGMNLYGAEMDENVSPLVANMAWTIAWEPSSREFIGRDVIEQEHKSGVKEKLVGLLLVDKGVLRGHQKVIVPGVGEGITTSGTYSPTLERGIALARVPAATGDRALIDMRGKTMSVQVVKPCFVRNGKAVY